jgi:hypothetical protein
MLELEPASDEARNALHHPLPSPPTAHIDIALVGIDAEVVSMPFTFSVKFRRAPDWTAVESADRCLAQEEYSAEALVDIRSIPKD